MRDVTVRFTEHPGHATAITRELLDCGYERIIAVGGDGTVNEVANGFLKDDRPVNPGAILAVVPQGTGGDFQRSLSRGELSSIDVGKAVFQANDGSRQTRYFVNVVSFGMGGEVASRAHNFLSPLGGKIAFQYATAVALLKYRARNVRLNLDGAEHAFTILNVAVGNGRYHGGGMHVCPLARLDDGLLEVTVIENLGILRLIKDLPVLYSDNLYVHPKTRHFRAKNLWAEAGELTRIEIDGEPLGSLPLEITLLPQALKVATCAY